MLLPDNVAADSCLGRTKQNQVGAHQKEGTLHSSRLPKPNLAEDVFKLSHLEQQSKMSEYTGALFLVSEFL